MSAARTRPHCSLNTGSSMPTTPDRGGRVACDVGPDVSAGARAGLVLPDAPARDHEPPDSHAACPAPRAAGVHRIAARAAGRRAGVDDDRRRRPPADRRAVSRLAGCLRDPDATCHCRHRGARLHRARVGRVRRGLRERRPNDARLRRSPVAVARGGHSGARRRPARRAGDLLPRARSPPRLPAAQVSCVPRGLRARHGLARARGPVASRPASDRRRGGGTSASTRAGTSA